VIWAKIACYVVTFSVLRCGLFVNCIEESIGLDTVDRLRDN